MADQWTGDVNSRIEKLSTSEEEDLSQGQQKHSGIGIASFVTSVAAGALMFVLFVIAGVIEITTPGGMSENSVEALIVGFIALAITIALIVATGLGIKGLYIKETRKVFAILGTSISVVFIVVTSLAIIIGINME